MIIEWALAERAVGDPAEDVESGDLYVVAPWRGGALVAVIDGLGHGTEAAIASRTAARVLETHAREALDALVKRCHADLAQTRGAVMSLAVFDSESASMTWVGVGNVNAVLVRADANRGTRREALSLRGGLVGYQIPTLRPATVAVSPGDTLIMVTDGIRSAFTDGVDLRDSPQSIVDSILSLHSRQSDDALALAVRYLGGEPEQPDMQATHDRRPHAETLDLEGFEGIGTSIAINEDVDVTIACKHVRDLALQNRLSPVAAEELATATSELARNILMHATNGEILLGALQDSNRRGVFVVARDRGPGMHDVELAVQDGYSSAQGLGLGLSSARRLTDEFDISTSPGEGTTVIVKKWAR